MKVGLELRTLRLISLLSHRVTVSNFKINPKMFIKCRWISRLSHYYFYQAIYLMYTKLLMVCSAFYQYIPYVHFYQGKLILIFCLILQTSREVFIYPMFTLTHKHEYFVTDQFLSPWKFFETSKSFSFHIPFFFPKRRALVLET